MIEKLISCGCVVCKNCRAEVLSTYKSGGVVNIVVYPTTQKNFIQASEILKASQLPFEVVGNGSNILISDKGLPALICTRKLQSISFEEERVYALSGVRLPHLAKLAMEAGFSGLEFATGIPASVGGGSFMNCGAYGAEIADIIEYVDVYFNGEEKRIFREELDYGYRKCETLMDKIILGVGLRLRKGEKEEILKVMQENTLKRKASQPSEPSLGSVFKRYQDTPVPLLIEELGIKGKKIGGAEISTKHCGFIVNKGKSTSNEYVQMVDFIKKKVYNKYKILLETEVKFLGEF